MGLMNPIANGPFFALIQAKVDPGVQGRVMTMINSITSGLTPFALIIAGPLADRFGIQAWFVLGGILCLVIAVLMGVIKVIYTLKNNQGIMCPCQYPDKNLNLPDKIIKRGISFLRSLSLCLIIFYNPND